MARLVHSACTVEQLLPAVSGSVFVSQLSHLKSDWESLAQRDALGAILTDETKSGGKWEVTEFMPSAEAEIEPLLQHLEAIGLKPNGRGPALDFGCGVGRLTQAMARRFSSCV